MSETIEIIEKSSIIAIEQFDINVSLKLSDEYYTIINNAPIFILYFCVT